MQSTSSGTRAVPSMTRGDVVITVIDPCVVHRGFGVMRRHPAP